MQLSDVFDKKLGFGCLRLPHHGDDASDVDVEQMKQMVDLFLEKGFTYFDTAHRYHDEASEPAARKALTERYPRDQYILTNKITLNYIHRQEDQESFLRRQLELCGVDYFDNYLLHNMGAVWYPMAEQLGTFQFLREMRDKGLVRHIGFSFHGTIEMPALLIQYSPRLVDEVYADIDAIFTIRGV